MSKITRNDLQKVLKKYHKKNTEIIKDMNDKIKTNSNFIDENKAKIESMEENLDINSQFVDVEIKGRTLVNLLGRYGNAIYKQFDTNHKYGKLTYESDSYVIESEQLENGWITTLDTDITFTKDKYYICLGEVYVESGNRGNVNITSKATNIKHQYREATETGKWVNCWEASQCGDVADGVSKVYFAAVSFGTGSKTKFRNMRVYELTKEQYDYLDGKERDEVAELYPYVDDVKPVVNPYFESKENLLGDDYWVEGAIYPDGTVNTSADTGNIVNISANIFTKKDDVYTLHIKDLDTAIYKPILWNMGGTQGAVIGTDTDTIKITCEHDGILKCGIRRVDGAKDDTNMKVLSDLLNNRVLKPCIVKGDTAKSYDECSNSRIMFETKVYDGETISRRNDGVYVKNSEWEEVDILPDNLEIRLGGYYPGAKGITIPKESFKGIILDSLTSEPHQLVTYNGEVAKHEISFSQNTDKHCVNYDSYYTEGNGSAWREVSFIVPSTITGWGDNYTPTLDEVKAFLLGWRMNSNNGIDWESGVYNGTGTKTWAKLWCGIGGKTGLVVNGTSTTDLPTVMNDKGYTPYKLIYKKENPTIEEVKTYGGLVVKNRVDITSGSGLVLNYKSELSYSDDYSYYTHTPLFVLKDFARDILAIKTSDNEICSFSNVYRVNRGDDASFLAEYGRVFAKNISPAKDNFIFMDYLLLHTVTSYDYTITSDNSIESILNKTQNELIATKEELARTKKELEHTKYELSQRNNPNLLINGDFQVWQRGENFNVRGNQYIVDRWKIDTSPLDSFVFSKSYINEISALQYNCTQMNEINIEQVIEYGVKKYKGKPLTLSWISEISSDANYSLLIYAYSDDGRSNISFLTTSISYKAGCVEKHAITFKIPKQTADIYSHLRVRILRRPDKVNHTIKITNVKLELGEYATPFVPKTYAEELRDCQRYYQTLTPSQIIMSTSTNEFVSTYIPLQGLMRQSGTVILPTESNVLYIKEINENVGEIYPIITTATASHQIYIKAVGSFDSTKIYKLCITKTIGVDAEIY